MTVKVGSQVELSIDRLAAGGDGVGRLDGRAVFVPRVAPGDRVSARLLLVRPKYLKAELVEVLEPGPSRREPPCRYFGICGGCSWQHIDDEAQLEARKQLVLDALERIGKFDALPEPELMRSPKALGYRSRARVASDGRRLGYRRTASHALVDVDLCVVLDDATQRELNVLRADTHLAGDYSIRGYAEKVEIGPHMLHVSPHSFFQANRTLWEAWLARVVKRVGRGKTLVEFFSGAGFYTAGLVNQFDKVIAIEWSAAVHDAERNSNATVIRDAAEGWAARELKNTSPDAVLLNPPRIGADRILIDSIAAARPSRLVYVSCNPSTLARDLNHLRDAYAIETIDVIDALPQTHHVETIVSLNHVDMMP